MTAGNKTPIDIIKQAKTSGVLGSLKTELAELTNEPSPLSVEECERFLQALDQVSSSLRPMLVQHFHAFAQLNAHRPISTVVMISEQMQMVAATTAAQIRSSPQMDPFTLASAAVALLSPYLAKAGEGAAKKIGEDTVESGGRLLGWLHTKLGGRAKEALDDLAAKPSSEDNQADLRKQLAKALEANPAFATELRTMLPSDAEAMDSMSQNVSGPGAKAAQVKGSNNTTSIG